ncbi:uncharacterized protein LOC142541783 [Primulina tabacum]|uniref:uncharacterized protein LOC142541783 n=1 Tax=Primulina tabacum TaxID=48773 RepID=UPI003F5A6FB4
MWCVISVRYSFSLNGELVVNISPSRGLRQGDPLSPYLFVLCAHGLSSALLSLENHRLLSRVRIASSCPPISHLFFADDNLLFFRATLEDCMVVRNCLELYERASGQLINFEKSSLSFSPNTNEQAIPTYAMSCFRIPKSICEEIERECANFWWGKEERRRRLHWKKWRDLCKPKCQGGLGFRHLETFNRALMVKQVTSGKGVCLKVGDGSKIPTFAERWIPWTRDCVSPPPESEHFATVSTLLDGKSWNEPLIHNLFPPHLVKDILTIPLSQSQKEDFRFWAYDPKAKYSVRDGYKVAIGFFDSPPSCSGNHSIEWWRFIWSLSIPPKVRIFWWRVMQNIIPTEQNLRAHHVPVLGECPLCRHLCDSTVHALFTCPVIKRCWKGTYYWPILKLSCHLDVIVITLWMKEKLSIHEFEAFVMRVWAIWSERLRITHILGYCHSAINIEWCESLLQDFQEACRALRISPARNLLCAPTAWMAPPMHSLRMDVDACYNEHTHRYSIGGVIRNHDGQPILVFGNKIEKPSYVLYAELLVIIKGLNMSSTHNLRLHHISSDSLLAVQAVLREEENLSYAGALALDIRRLLALQGSPTLSHARRSANCVAQAIASFVSSSHSPFVWERGSFHFWLIDLIIKDFFSFH